MSLCTTLQLTHLKKPEERHSQLAPTQWTISSWDGFNLDQDILWNASSARVKWRPISVSSLSEFWSRCVLFPGDIVFTRFRRCHLVQYFSCWVSRGVPSYYYFWSTLTIKKVHFSYEWSSDCHQICGSSQWIFPASMWPGSLEIARYSWFSVVLLSDSSFKPDGVAKLSLRSYLRAPLVNVCDGCACNNIGCWSAVYSKCWMDIWT